MVLQDLEDIRQKAADKAGKGDSFARLVEICEEALKLEGDLYRLAARAAIAEVARSWLEAVHDNSRSNEDFEQLHLGRLMQADIPRVIEELEAFSSKVCQKIGEVFRVTEDIDEALQDPTRIIAKFRREEWRGPDEDQLHLIDTEYWDVTKRVKRMTTEEIRSLQDHDYSTDELVQPYAKHDGPHSVQVTDQIQKYWRHQAGERLWE